MTRGLLIVNADDLGYDRHHTDAILDCAREGRITSASGMVFMQDSVRAAELAAGAGIGIGLHLNLSEAFSAGDVPDEVRETQARLLGRFQGTRARQAHRWLYDPLIRATVQQTIGHQLARFQEIYGRPPTHFDGHQHVHLSPNVLLAQGIPPRAKMRRGLNRPGGRRPGVTKALRHRMLTRRFVSTDWFFDIADVDPRADGARAEQLLDLSHGATVEVMAHPGFGHEAERLRAPEWLQVLEGRPLGSYADLAATTDR
jgi:predicted glycoside hydrolase/deacetylase ChbG (UPF0249 family)